MWLACSPATFAGNLCRVVFQDVRKGTRGGGSAKSYLFSNLFAGNSKILPAEGATWVRDGEGGVWGVGKKPKSALHHNVWIPDVPSCSPEHLQVSVNRHQLPVGREPFSCTATRRISLTPRGLLDLHFHITLLSLFQAWKCTFIQDFLPGIEEEGSVKPITNMLFDRA